MNTLERASRELIERPLRSPTSVPVIQKRAAQIRRRRSAAIAACGTAILIVVGVSALFWRAPHQADVSTDSLPVPRPHDTLTVGPGTPFIPPTQVDGDQTRLPITLVNGDTIELGYPTDLDLAALGLTPATGIQFEPEDATGNCCSRRAEIRHGTIADVFGDRMPTATYSGANGQAARYFTGSNINYLAFQIGDWVVAVPDYENTAAGAANLGMTDTQRAAFAERLTGYQTAEGFLVLTPQSLALTEIDAPSIAFGANDLSLIYRPCSNSGGAQPNDRGFSLEARDAGSGTWLCYSRIPIVVHITGAQQFQDSVADGLEILSNHQAAYG